jgi:uncharacterized protein YggE
MSSRKQRRHRLLVAGLSLGALAVPPAPAAADGAGEQQALIVAQGAAVVHVQPDSIRVTLSVDEQAATLDAATSQVNTAMSAVVDALHTLPLPGLKIETQQVQFAPVYGTPANNNEQAIVAYSSSNQILVSLQQVAEADLAADAAEIVDAALHAGANRLGGVEFFRADLSSAEDQALTLAVQNAQRDAETMARAANVRLTGPVSIEEGSASRMPIFPQAFAPFAGAAAETPIEAPTLDVQANVTVKYAFQ